MAFKKQYFSDLSGKAIEGKPKTLTLSRAVTKNGYWGRYRATEDKKLHLTAAEAAEIFTPEIRQWLGFEAKPASEKKAKTKKGAKA